MKGITIYPNIDMEMIAEMHGYPVEDAARKIVNKVALYAGGIHRANCGERVLQVLIEEGIDECSALMLMEPDDFEIPDILKYSLTFWGEDMDCDECGCEMVVVDGDYTEHYDIHGIEEPSYTPIWERRRCVNCGHETSNEPEY